jgi:hypothetical protein
MSPRILAAIGILYVAFNGLPDIELPEISPSRPATPVKEPSMEMQDAVAGVAEIAKTMTAFDRMVWMATWEDMSSIVDGADPDVSVDFDNTLALKFFVDSAFKVAWNRLANASGKYAGLGDAVEQAFMDTIGNEVEPWTDYIREDAVDLFDALAWAGARSE